jgi:hypothetical protein
LKTRPVKLPPSRQRRPGAVRAHRPGEVIRCLLLAEAPDEWVGVDVATGALVRSRTAVPWASAAHEEPGAPPPEQLRALDLVDFELAHDAEPMDPARPEAVAIAGPPKRVGASRRRPTRRMLRGLVPTGPTRPLLGTLGPSVAYEDLDGSRPSVVLVAPDQQPKFVSDGATTWCQFSHGGRRHRLAVVDGRIRAPASGSRLGLFADEAVSAAIGGLPRYLVVALGSPVHGQSPKLVLGVLPRP